jgi:hypothetical protein
VRQRSRVEHDGVGVVGRAVQPADQLGLRVGLADLDVQTQLAALLLQLLHQLGVRRRAVGLRLPAAELAQVRAVEDEDPAHSLTSA